jgi:glycosyltransferase involved in cell wall biosynthesis
MITVPDLTVIMCAYNEVERIGPALDDFFDSARDRTESVEVIIVDNGSTDGTREWLENLEHPETRVIFNSKNLGKGGSIRKAISASSGQYVVIHDPDLEYKAADVWKLLDATRDTNATMGLGSRVIGGNASYEYFVNYLGVRLLTWSINLLFGARLTDSATAMKMLDGDHARLMKLRCSGFDLDFELVTSTLRMGGTIIETRADYSPRTVAQGKKLRAYRDGFAALRAILRDRIRAKRKFTTVPGLGICPVGPDSADNDS